MKNNNQINVPQAREAMDKFKILDVEITLPLKQKACPDFTELGALTLKSAVPEYGFLLKLPPKVDLLFCA